MYELVLVRDCPDEVLDVERRAHLVMGLELGNGNVDICLEDRVGHGVTVMAAATRVDSNIPANSALQS